MFDFTLLPGTDAVEVLPALSAVLGWLGRTPKASDDAERIDRIALLEQIKAAAAGAQVRETNEFLASQVTLQRSQNVPERRVGRGVAEQIAFARGVSPAMGARLVATARALRTELPCTNALLRDGRVSEWVASLVVKETSQLDREDRRRVDADLAAELARFSPREAEAAARRLAYQADPESAVRRAAVERKDRRVTIRPLPDTMANLSAVAPAEQAVAAWACLEREARAAKAAGDRRSLGQIRCDTLIERLTGQKRADLVPVEVGLTMTSDSLLDADDDAADLRHYGPIPADIARDIITGPATPDLSAEQLDHAAVFVRRLFTDPITDRVTTVDPRRRRFDGTLARLVQARDQVCREPGCNAPIRHLDHVQAHHLGGPTTAENGQGLCERGNYVKQMPGWRATVDAGGVVMTTTPTGHTYPSPVPPAMGAMSNRTQISRRRVQRRLDYLARERLIRNLPSSPAPPPHHRQ